MVKIDFERETKYGIFRDSITLPESHPFSQTDIDSMMQQRVDNYVSFLDNPPEPESAPEYIEVDGVRYVKVT
jgi:hypothetical protein